MLYSTPFFIHSKIQTRDLCLVTQRSYHYTKEVTSKFTDNNRIYRRFKNYVINNGIISIKISA
jgi:hypothetical protein